MATKRARVLYDYDAKDQDQLTIKAGQLVEIQGTKTAEGWVLAKSKGQEGYVPAQYLEEAGGGPPPKPPQPGGGGGFTMPPTRLSEGGNTKQPDKKPVKPSTIARGNANSDSRKASLNQSAPFQADDAYSIFAYYMEWFGVVGMFMAGLFAFMYGTITIDPEGLISMVFGFGAMLGASILAIAITVMRDSINCAMQSPPLSRCLLFCCCMCTCGGGFPIAALGDGAICFAAMANLLAHVKEASGAVTSDNWSVLCTDCIDCQTVWRIAFLILFVAADGGAFYFGYTNGVMFAATRSLGDRIFLDEVTWGFAEGFGTVISFNMAAIFVFSLDAIRNSFLERASANPNACNTGLAWLCDKDAHVFAHTFGAISLVVATFLHMICNFAAYENSGAYRSYLTIFGIIPLGTGVGAFAILTIIMSGSHENIKRNLPRLFRVTHILSVFLAILLVFHGPGGLSRNFWKWIVGPLVLYLVDVLFRASGTI